MRRLCPHSPRHFGHAKADFLLPVFFVLFVVSYLAHGAGSVPRFDVIGKAIPASQRGAFFARRNLWAGVVGFGASLVVRHILNAEPGPPLVNRYAWLIGFLDATTAPCASTAEP